jgi:hypothetical protein
MKHVHLVLTVFALLSVFNLAPTVTCQSKPRVLRSYESGPVCDLRHQFWDPVKFNEEKTPCRQFIWQTWKSHTKAVSIVKFYTREGAQLQCRFFVERNSNGRWIVTKKCRGGPCPYVSKARCRTYAKNGFTVIFAKIERIEPGYDHFKTLPPIVLSEEEVRTPSKFALLFRNAAGESNEPF